MTITSRDRRMLIALGVVLLAAVAYYVLFLHRADDAGVDAPAAPAPAAVQPSPSPSPEASAREDKQKRADDRDSLALVFSGRDPFQPLVNPSAPPVPNPSATPSVAPASNPPSGPGGGSSVTIGGRTVVLVDVFREGGQDRAQVEVDGTVYTVSVGESFADSFQLVAVSGSCADFLFGEQSFTLCETSNK